MREEMGYRVCGGGGLGEVYSRIHESYYVTAEFLGIEDTKPRPENQNCSTESTRFVLSLPSDLI